MPASENELGEQPVYTKQSMINLEKPAVHWCGFEDVSRTRSQALQNLLLTSERLVAIPKHISFGPVAWLLLYLSPANIRKLLLLYFNIINQMLNSTLLKSFLVDFSPIIHNHMETVSRTINRSYTRYQILGDNHIHPTETFTAREEHLCSDLKCHEKLNYSRATPAGREGGATSPPNSLGKNYSK
jgi:hypothetical protein